MFLFGVNSFLPQILVLLNLGHLKGLLHAIILLILYLYYNERWDTW